ncbi:MAG: hypothetical protein PF488_04140 [Patescibacteria group bacterium]|jgi:hypothetical protein|nr:hypothetical protein [Patescibacteria group bacterium]
MINKPSKEKNKKSFLKKGIFFFLSLTMVFSLMSAPKPVYAQNTDFANLAQAIKDFFDTQIGKAIQKAGSIAYQRTLSNALNKISYDAANYIGSGGRGQSELFVTEDWGSYLKNIGDEAAGDFLESFVRNLDSSDDQKSCEERTYDCYNECYQIEYGESFPDDYDNDKAYTEMLELKDFSDNQNTTLCIQQCEKAATSCSGRGAAIGTSRVIDDGSDYNSFDVCQPSSVEAKLKISLGLSDSINGSDRASGPNCTGSEIINNWGEGIEGVYDKIESIQDGSLFANINDYFDPRGNDLGIYLMADSDMTKKVDKTYSVKSSSLEANQGWLDVRNIAGVLEGTPLEARQAEQEARDIKTQNFGKTTGDILVDASNLFLNQLAVSAYNNVMRKLSDKSSNQNLSDYSSDPGQSTLSGESRMKEKTRVLIEPQFESKSDYSILAELFSCPDPENPGYNSCVINDRFMQAINEGVTVGEAIEEGYLNSSWRIEKDYYTNAHNNHFSLRNIKILRKYRVLPLGWEVAIEKAYENEENPKDATLGDLVACFDEFDEYDKFSSSFEGLNNDWCEGLVDPSWVLKAPLNYCAKEGAGAQVLSSFLIPGMKDVAYANDTLSELMVLRDDNYCADNQSCIKEGEGGGCDLYGYCTEEKRTWDFDGNSCSPIANTCQLFTNTESNEKISYLQNTIDYADCNIDNAGCKLYSYNGQYDLDTGNVAWDTNYSLNLNNNLSSCNNSSQGCSELLRVKPTWGSNLIIDSNFRFIDEDNKLDANYWDYSGSRVELIEDMSEEIYGQASYRVAKITGIGLTAGIRSTENLFPKDLQILPNQNYTLSADVYLAKGQSLTLTLNPGDYSDEKTINQEGEWVNISVTGSSNFGLLSPSFEISAENIFLDPVFYFKNVKLELGDWSTGYSSYGSYKVYQKLLPDYLEETCYQDVSSAEKDFSLKEDASSICSNYTKKCNASEVGCNLYTGVYNNLSLPAQVSSSDYCANECVGYDMYIARATYFNPAETENIIPANSENCSIQAVGCNEFTNLDAIAEGGENKEYYVSLKHCIKPNTEECGEFYSWENGGIGDLTRYTLQKDEDGNPLTVGDLEEGDCSDIYDLSPSNPNYNPDCKQFVNVEGENSYKLYSKVVTCSDNCYSYRLSGNNIDKNIRSEEVCEGEDKEVEDKSWNQSAEVCYVCKNGGTWSTVHNACVYQAIPSEGTTCRAQENGCREYNGSNGSNTRIVSAYDFEVDYDGWYSNCEDGVSLSSVSNSEDGQSLLYNASATSCDNTTTGQIAKVNIGYDINKDKGYTLRFIARSENDAVISLYFQDSSSGEKYFFNSSLETEEPDINIEGGGSWQVYEVSLGNLEDEISIDGTLNLSGDNSILIDNITLTEITDRYYLKKNTSQIPDICYYDNLGEYQGPDYNLGCTLYRDKDDLSHALHNFTSLCSYDSVGCEQMIDTNNYSSPTKGIWNDGGDGQCDLEDEDCVEVERDTAIYAVYNRAMSCAPSEAGCSLMGQASGEGQSRSWSNVSKVNDPDTYSNTLCLSKDINCDEYKLDSGSYLYFKNPGNNLCVYKSGNEPSNQKKSWYKAPVKRCDYDNNNEITGEEMNEDVCSTNLDCGEDTNCITDNNDYPCSTSYFKTIGLGGTGGEVAIPNKATALCEANSSGCSEYIDPVSKFNPNLVINPNYKESDNETFVAWGDDLWLEEEVEINEQVVQLERNKLYSMVVTRGENKLGTNCNDVTLQFARNSIRFLSVKRCDYDMNGEITGEEMNGDVCNTNLDCGENIDCIIDNKENNNFSEEPVDRVIIDETEKPVIFSTFDNYSGLLTRPGNLTNIYSIEIRELSINYQYKNDVNKSDCSGLTDFDNGCVLFNERSINGSSGLRSNIYNSFQTPDGKTPISSKDPLNANQLIKVTPDRECGKWLTCTSYGIDSNGQTQCYSLGECNMLDEKNECANVIDYSPGEQTTFDPDRNRNSSGYALANMNYYSNIKEVGLNTVVHYNFEDAAPSLSCETDGDETCSFDTNISKDLLVREPEGAPTDYPAEGKTYLKVNPGQWVSPHGKGANIILPEPDDYYLNFLLNTKDSGREAVIRITRSDDSNVVERVSSLYGWERKVIEFSTENPNTEINIYLGSGSEYPVYFDDLNIEPVLQLSDNDYVSKDCRLYPTSESLGCYDNNNSIVRNGLEGYCLEYDLANPDICQQWLPVDKISSSQLPSSKLGYTGKAPLSYCAEANLNFSLLENRKAVIVKQEHFARESDKADNVRQCYYPGPSLNYCKIYFGDDVTSDDITYYTTSGETTVSTGISLASTTDGYDGSGTVTVDSNTDPHALKYDTKIDDNDYELNLVTDYCNSEDYFLIKFQDVSKERDLWWDQVAVTWVCAPINNSVYGNENIRWTPSKVEEMTMFDGNTTFTSFTDGWYIANGFSNVSGQVSDGEAIGFNEATNSTPPIRVLDRNFAPPASEDDLKKVYSKNSDEMFELTCDKFVEVVTGSGENVAQVSKVLNNTNNEIEISNSNIKFNNYIRNLGDVPYGAASWPNDFNLIDSKRVSLYNQSTNDDIDNVFAGRPYGCSFEGDDGDTEFENCSMIGSCSGNPDVYCLLDSEISNLGLGSNSSFDLAKQSCGSYGICQPLWTAKNGSIDDFKNQNMPSYGNALSQIFLKSYNAYLYDPANGGYISVEGYDKSSSVVGVAPVVENIELYYDETKKQVKEEDQLKAGNYRLEFNTEIDPNQQPLKQIVIDWGDFKQVVIDENYRPDSTRPHVFYHYYSNADNAKDIEVRVIDNWGKSSDNQLIEL